MQDAEAPTMLQPAHIGASQSLQHFSELGEPHLTHSCAILQSLTSDRLTAHT